MGYKNKCYSINLTFFLFTVDMFFHNFDVCIFTKTTAVLYNYILIPDIVKFIVFIVSMIFAINLTKRFYVNCGFSQKYNALIRNFIHYLFTDKKSKRVSAATRYKVEKKVGLRELHVLRIFFHLLFHSAYKIKYR